MPVDPTLLSYQLDRVNTEWQVQAQEEDHE